MARLRSGLVASILLVPGAAPAEPWSAGAPLPEARQEVAVAELDGRVYVIGGFRSDASIADTVEVYDPETDSWSTAAPLPTPVHHAAAASLDGTVYVVGGWPDFFATPLASLFAYDAGTDSWSSRAPMPTARGSPAAAVLDGKLYVAGGWPAARLQDFALYDPTEDQWTALPGMPTGRNHLGAAAVGGLLYAVGGRQALGAGLGTVSAVEAFDPASGWSARAPLPRARGGLAVATVGGFVLAFGGEGNAGDPDGVFEDVDAFDPDSDVWTSVAPLPTPRHGIGAAVVDRRVYVPGGGAVQGFGVTDVNEIYDARVELDLAPPVPLLPPWAAGSLAVLLLLSLGWARGVRARARERPRRLAGAGHSPA